jgi:orotidine-5'-phosphate decarboxylase
MPAASTSETRRAERAFQTTPPAPDVPSPVIVALDFESSVQAKAMVERLDGEADHFITASTDPVRAYKSALSRFAAVV